MRERKR